MPDDPHPSHCFAMGPFPLPLRSAVEGGIALSRADKGVLFLAGAELDVALARHLGEGEDDAVIFDRRAVDARAAAFDQAARLALAGGEAGAVQEVDRLEAAGEVGARYLDARQIVAGAALAEGAPRGLRRGERGLGAVGHR